MQSYVTALGENIVDNLKNKIIGDDPFCRRLAVYLDYNGPDYPRRVENFQNECEERFGKKPARSTIDTWVNGQKKPGSSNLKMIGAIMGYNNPHDMYREESELPILPIDKIIDDEFIILIEKLYEKISKNNELNLINLEKISPGQKEIIRILLRIDITDIEDINMVKSTLNYIEKKTKLKGQRGQQKNNNNFNH